jgi:hypothetical protein
VANGLVYRYWDVNQDTQPTTNILPHNSPIQSLLWDADQGLIYAGLQQGRVFRSADYGQNWLSISDELPDAADILALAIGVPQSYTTYKALDELRARDEAINRQQGSLPYPVILSLSSQTRLPAFLRTRLLTPLSVQIDDQSESPSITEVLTPLQIQAIFGLSSTQPDDLDENLSEQLNSQLKPGRILKLTGKTSQNGNQQAHQLRHLTWHQYYHELPVIGGSVRVHGVIEEDRIAVTNSYFPIPLDYAFTSTPERTEAPLAGVLAIVPVSPIPLIPIG